eukprot:2054544-Amphidinium_carterae.1
MDSSESAERERHLEQRNGLRWQDVPECYRADREIVLAAVTQEGDALRFAARECKADREIVLAAVTQDGLALQYAAEECKADSASVQLSVRPRQWQFTDEPGNPCLWMEDWDIQTCRVTEIPRDTHEEPPKECKLDKLEEVLPEGQWMATFNAGWTG